MKLLIDSIDESVSGLREISFDHIGLLIGIMGAAALLSALVKSLGGLVEQAQARVVTDYMQDILHEKSVEVDLAYYEDPRFHDTLHRAQSEAPYRPTRMVNELISTLQGAVSLLAMVGLLMSFHWFIAIVLPAAALPGVFVKLRYSRVSWKWQRRRTDMERQAAYRHWLLTAAEHAKELRLFGLGDHFRRSYRDLRSVLRSEMIGIAKRRALADLVAQGVAAVLVYGSLAFIAWQAFGGLITIGGMVMYFGAFQRGLGYLRDLLGSLAGLYEGNLFLSNLFEFLDIEQSVADPPSPAPYPDPITGGIEFDRVRFRYASSPDWVLDDVTLSIRQGEMLALVGENGSGKTTLVKLLCRLYDPDSGMISIDGIPLTDLALDEHRRHLSVLFQDYTRYHLSAAENIGLGDLRREPEADAIRKAAVAAGADGLISGFREGFDTILGRRFEGGMEPSIGEWQKIALARAFFREAPVVVLDEPTSALDARTERDVFTGFKEMVRGRTAIVISHRFSTVRMADRIAVMRHGRIIELGTHSELMDSGGMYRELYTIQSSAFS